MAKIGTMVAGGLQDISTEFRVAPEAAYMVKIEKVEVKESGKSKLPMIVVTTTIVDETAADGSNVAGIMMDEYFVLKTKDGKDNEAGLRQFKKLIEDTLGEDRANDSEFDTDELVGWMGTAQVKIESYEVDGESRRKNVIKKYVG